MGENLTLFGLDWAQVLPGSRLKLGESVLLEITAYTSPCKTITDSFADGYYNRISQKLNPGWSRVYARVLQPGFHPFSDLFCLHNGFFAGTPTLRGYPFGVAAILSITTR